jgi:uncharacterized protein (DUF927 family)
MSVTTGDGERNGRHAADRGRGRLGRAPQAKGGKAAVRRAVADAPQAAAPKAEGPAGFEMREAGLWRLPGEGEAPFRVCGAFEVLAETRPEDGEDWGLLLRWHDRDGTEHEWIMRQGGLAGEAVQVRERLASCGLEVGTSEGARRALVQYLAAIRSPNRVRTVPHTGWYRPQGGGAAFVMPSRTVGAVTGEVVRLNIEAGPELYQERGTLAGWQAEVAGRCMGNSRLLFGVACGFTGPLLPLIGAEGGGFNLRGDSSKGKTTIIDTAASVWGAPSKTGPDAFVRQWRTTANALDATAAAHDHTLLPMDEMGQADPREIPETLYMLGNGTGKERARAGGGNRKRVTFTTLVLSSSEESAARMAEAAGRRMKAGQEVRLLDIPAIVPGGYGCFEELHGEPEGAAFAQAMRRAVLAAHGAAGPAFVEYIAARLVEVADFPAVVLGRMDAWTRAQVPGGADGQVRRAAGRLALVAVAGELAGEAGVTGWPPGTAAQAVATVFRVWLDERGGGGGSEDMHLFAALRRFIAAHGSSRFEPLKIDQAEDQGGQTEPPLPDGPKTIQRVGWRWQEANEAGEQVWIYGMVPGLFATEIAGPLGMEEKDARARMGKAGVIRCEQGGGETRWTVRHRIPGHGRLRLVVIDGGKLLAGDDG